MGRTMITETCRWCGKQFEMWKTERKRQIKHGAINFFCSRSCSCYYGNSLKGNIRKPITKVCPECKSTFETMTGKREATFCSRSCASRGSITPYRSMRAAETARAMMAEHRPEMVAAGLRKREWWRYEGLDAVLKAASVRHLFEYPLRADGTFCVYDLALIDRNVLIEFDGPYHDLPGQIPIDAFKEQVAADHGWQVLRIKVPTGAAVPADALELEL